MEGADLQALHALGQKTGGLENEVIGLASGLRCRRAIDAKSQRRAGLKPEIVARAGKGHEAYQIVIAVGPAPEHMERQVDLGGRAGGKWLGHGASMPESGAVGKSDLAMPLQTSS
jgi:hypothetical protein